MNKKELIRSLKLGDGESKIFQYQGKGIYRITYTAKNKMYVLDKRPKARYTEDREWDFVAKDLNRSKLVPFVK
ncbi:MAG: hypothetical protein ACRC0F_03175 [Cetobacterium sp.]